MICQLLICGGEDVRDGEEQVECQDDNDSGGAAADDDWSDCDYDADDALAGAAAAGSCR